MFYNLKIAIRNLRRNGLYSVINIVGLTVSLATCILITLWVYDELSYDRFHVNKENLYLVNSSVNNESFFNHCPSGLAVYAKEEIPDVKDFCRIQEHFSFTHLEYNGRQILLNNSTNPGAAIDSSFFRIFTFPLLEGDAQTPFAGDFSIILSESMAKAVFGDEDPMGKAIRTSWGNEYFHVTGIVRDMPENSSLQYDYLVPFSLLKLNFVQGPIPFNELDEDLGRFNYRTYLELYQGSSIERVEEKLKDIMVRGVTPYIQLMGFMELPDIQFPLQKITDQHLYTIDGTPGGIAKVRLFGIIAGLILIIACINYVNLVTARTGKRSKEMGVRRFLGAKWNNIIGQSLQETCIMLVIAIVMATLLIYIIMPFYNQISGKNMEFELFSFHVLFIYGITFICVLGLAGLYPSFYLASFRSTNFTNNKAAHTLFRRGLVVVQFVCSIALIMATLVITLQMNFMRKKDLGYDKENIICFAAWPMTEHIETVKNELLQNPAVTGVATASLENMINHNHTFGISWPGKETDKAINFGFVEADYDFLQLMNIQLVDGQMPPESSDGVYCLLNETAVREMLLNDPLHLTLTLGNWSFTVSGIVRDFHFASLNQPIAPMILLCTKSNQNFFYVKTTTLGTQSALASIEKIWKTYCPNLLFNYSFLDENFELLYRTDIQVGMLLYVFAFIAIMISCLGLFGLVTFTAETKTKEIGIRKVLGASVGNIVNMLSKEFLVLVGIAMFIAFPIAYYWLDRMLQDYAYRIEIGWWIFVLAGIITIALTLLTVGWQAIKSATANPVKSIMNCD